jgi:predicted  nucleic acid-binding Zn-ribbon protein
MTGPPAFVGPASVSSSSPPKSKVAKDAKSSSAGSGANHQSQIEDEPFLEEIKKKSRMLDAELANFKAENEKIRKARDEAEVAVQKLKQEQSEFEKRKVEEMAKLEKYKTEELKKLKREKKQVSLLHKVFSFWSILSFLLLIQRHNSTISLVLNVLNTQFP